MHIAIYHNILWSKYKGVVFSQVYEQSKSRGIDTSFIQIAETEDQRVALGSVDLSYHQYPFRLLFRGAYGASTRWQRTAKIISDILKHPSDLAVMPGYHRIEHWSMLLLFMLLRRKRAVFCDSTEFDQPKAGIKELAKRLFFSRCDGFFCYGIRSKEYLLKYGVKESRIIYRYQAAALPHDYDPAAVLAGYAASGTTAPAIHRFLYVGRLSSEKGLHDLLNAFSQIYATRRDVALDLIGAGALRAGLTARVAELGLDAAVTFLGPRDIREITERFMQSAALVLPSHSEPWGLVVNEALSYGCPVIVSSVCGCVPYLAVDGVTGYSFAVGDVQALATAMTGVIDMSKDRVGVAKRCLEVISAFTPQRAATQILDGCLHIVGDMV